jgi:dual specificity tyrosine-phosphorylation-regulated kinase 2/3/4
MQNSLHLRISDFQSSKLKRLTNAPLCTIPESRPFNQNSPLDSSSSPSNIYKIREKSINPKEYSKPTLKEPEKLSPSRALIKRTSSLSPARLSDREENWAKKKFHFPMPGSQAVLLYPELLSSTEKKEILKYPEVYFLGLKSVKVESHFHDAEGRYKAIPGDHISFRYEIYALLGKGTFGNVYKCYDHKRNLFVALKVMRNLPIIKEQSEIEIENLEKISDSDPDDSKCCIKYRQSFDFRGHICIAFELLSISLYQFLRENGFQGIGKGVLRRIAVQILIALRHIHDLGFIHCDIKPENILLKNANKSSIKLIDFGSATYKCAPFTSYLQSRYYRAPEVILGCGYCNKIDIWSFGCVIFELHTGYPLFTGYSEIDQLGRIMHIIGMPPEKIFNKATRTQEFFLDNGEAILEPDSRGMINKPGQLNLSELVQDSDLCAFLKKCLEWDPEMRFTAEEALRHPWISKSVNSRGERGRVWKKL